MKGFTVPAQLTRCSSLVDGGVTVGFHTKELTTQEKAEVMEFHNKSGYLLFKPNEIKDEDIPKQDAEYETKTPSQRLRGVLFVLWQQSGDTQDFEEFYRKTMEKIINSVKQRLE